MIKVGIIGASGYVGNELTRLLLNHPQVELVALSSHSSEGKSVAQLYPALYQRVDLDFCDPQTVIDKSDLIFISLPHGLSQGVVAQCFAAHKKCIDIGADFRLESEADYQQWYHQSFVHPDLHQQAVYGLTEFNREGVAAADLVANPGCYPTAVSLGLWPLVKSGFQWQGPIIVDAKSGVTGAGKSLTEATHFPQLNESFHPYSIGAHRHTPEIEQTLSHMADHEVTVVFVPHLLPVNRGILATSYVPVSGDWDLEAVHRAYQKCYQDEPFVRVLPLGAISDIKYVNYSNFCDISIHSDFRNQQLIVVSAIDNMIKGAAGQAIQNMNVMFQLPESTGLMMVSPSF